MEFRRLGAWGLKVPALSFGAGTFAGRGALFGAWGNTDIQEARRLVDICLVFRLAADEVAGDRAPLRPCALRRASGLLLPGRTRLRMGTDAARNRPVGAVVWSPLGWGRLTGHVRRGQPLPARSRLHQTADYGPPVPDEDLFRVVEALDEVAQETGKAIPQVAINWLLQRPTVSSVIIGARNEAQLRQNLGAIGWALTSGQMARLDAASIKTAPYPYFPYQRQEGFARLAQPAA